MSTDVILVCLLVGTVNYLFRYLPLRLGSRQKSALKSGPLSRVLDSIGIASICALLVVSGTPEILRDQQKLLPSLAGFALLALIFWRTKSIVIATLTGAVAYGLVFKLMLMAG
ncbi:L-valine transporter subunit YgaH [Rahnella perminowiae]|jgi:branched-subunit amino acid transport protein|uniref:L-valine transporter subunit YgaH n=1 Tax=Rahnella perminowiae TaxID=2816244 RepID=A0ABS6KVT5_9GAMM|nr:MULTISPECIES: L-valine transporter subunit YgaH [Rahnella]MBU9811100.1 L-valine transporter subunit YgaH [Rahnella perminowiae]MBU9824323.1 L-valine transporter subunit YgaH [Rahnella perminowiae]MBU9833609.1 L-valine transporter subunit YgaH [Rahnella perminowiae]MCR9002956.1 L-valine transporter subunit YgaH [Rahnella perminowiae]MCX2946001.1 L-valine transporter subunit YgaH [Rahnella perminowiae]